MVPKDVPAILSTSKHKNNVCCIVEEAASHARPVDRRRVDVRGTVWSVTFEPVVAKVKRESPFFVFVGLTPRRVGEA